MAPDKPHEPDAGAAARADARHPSLLAKALGSVDKRRSGVASGVLNSVRQTGSVIGVALFGSLVAASDGFLDGMKIALAISTLLAFCAAAIAIWIGPQRVAG